MGAVVIAALFVAIGAPRAGSTSYGGALDPTFGTDGIASTPFSDLGWTNAQIAALAVQPDGKILVGYSLVYGSPFENWLIARYNADGSPDTSFGHNGWVGTCINAAGNCVPGDEALTSLAAEPDGTILAVGTGDRGLTLVRYLSDGSLDPSFGAGGISPDPNQSNPPPPTVWPTVFGGMGASLLLPDGTILVLANNGVARFNADGTPDTSFGSDGLAALAWPSPSCACNVGLQSLAPGPNGTIVVSGAYWDTSGGASDEVESWAAERFTSDGSPDTSFGTNGHAIFPNGAVDPTPIAMAVEPDGSIFLGDRYIPNSTPPRSDSARLIHINADGTLDTNFGTNGVEITTPPGISTTPSLYSVYALLPQPNGQVIAVGDGDLGAPWHDVGFGLERFMPDGSPDPTFGVKGVAVVSFGARYFASPRTATIAPDGKIVAIGMGSLNTPNAPWSLLRMRYLPDGSTPLAIVETGTASGTVSSAPLGIDCKQKYDCAAQFANKSKVTLTAHPANGARVSWNGMCAAGSLSCRVTASVATRRVRVTFSKPRKSCVVPKVTGKLLGVAETAIDDDGCALRRVASRASATVAAGHVISQKPAAGQKRPLGTRVALVVSKGKR